MGKYWIFLPFWEKNGKILGNIQNYPEIISRFFPVYRPYMRNSWETSSNYEHQMPRLIENSTKLPFSRKPIFLNISITNIIMSRHRIYLGLEISICGLVTLCWVLTCLTPKNIGKCVPGQNLCIYFSHAGESRGWTISHAGESRGLFFSCFFDKKNIYTHA